MKIGPYTIEDTWSYKEDVSASFFCWYKTVTSDKFVVNTNGILYAGFINIYKNPFTKNWYFKCTKRILEKEFELITRRKITDEFVSSDEAKLLFDWFLTKLSMLKAFL